jgi:hypothetical protein
MTTEIYTCSVCYDEGSKNLKESNAEIFWEGKAEDIISEGIFKLPETQRQYMRPHWF